MQGTLIILLNYGFAWVAVLLAILLALKFVINRFFKTNESLKVIKQSLSKTHIPFGILLIITGFVHGYFSSEYILSFNLGTASWILSILLGINFMFRKLIKSKISWIAFHRLLTVLFLTCILWHVVDVGGIQIINELFPKKDTIVYEVFLDKKQDEKEYSKEDKTQPETSGTESSKSEAIHQEYSLPEASAQPEPAVSETPTTQEPPVSNSINSAQTLEQFNEGMQGVTLNDGTYTGVADGYGASLAVSVIVESNKVTNIMITAHNEKQSKYYARPILEIPEAIIDAQSLDVEAISGATFTSIGIINAVNDALSEALVSGKLPQMKTLPQQKRGKG